MEQMENWFLIWSTRIDTLMTVYIYIYIQYTIIA